MRLWTNGQVIISAQNDADRDALINELGLPPYEPAKDKTLDDTIKILEKAYPNLIVGLVGTWHELWDQEMLFFEGYCWDVEKLKKEKNVRGKLAYLVGDKWKLVNNGV